MDLLRDDDESRVSYLPIIAGVIALVAICIGGLLYVQSGSKQVSVAVNEPPPAPPAPVAQEFRVTRSEMPSALTAAAYTPPQRVFLPEVAYVGQSTLERSRSSNEPVFRSEHLQTDLGDS
ncbi:MAG: hypothetical protein HY248_07015, partial [Fimbriimonas ginsengisoli]|nr:hypothetical protein [Fimbriimonas ginsengisoli]